MNTQKEKNSIWYFLILLPIASSVFATIGGVLAVIGIICLVAWFLLFKASQNAFNDNNGKAWMQYIPFISKTGFRTTGQTVRTPPITPAVPPQVYPWQPPLTQTPPTTSKSLWIKNAPAFNRDRLTATIGSLHWSASDVVVLAAEAGENLQYGLAFRSRYGNLMAHSKRLDSIQMSEIAAKIKPRLPQNAVCRAWPLYELSKGINMDGLLVVPDKNKPLGLYLIIAGDNMKSRFTLFSMFIPVCTGKAEWIKKIYQPSTAELQSESDLATLILSASEQIAS